MSIFGDTFNSFFGDEVDENEKIELGNEILDELKMLGFDFQAQRHILRGETTTELPEILAAKLTQYQSWTTVESPEIEATASQSKPAYGDYEATGWMDK